MSDIAKCDGCGKTLPRKDIPIGWLASDLKIKRKAKDGHPAVEVSVSLDFCSDCGWGAVGTRREEIGEKIKVMADKDVEEAIRDAEAYDTFFGPPEKRPDDGVLAALQVELSAGIYSGVEDWIRQVEAGKVESAKLYRWLSCIAKTLPTDEATYAVALMKTWEDSVRGTKC